MQYIPALKEKSIPLKREIHRSPTYQEHAVFVKFLYYKVSKKAEFIKL